MCDSEPGFSMRVKRLWLAASLLCLAWTGTASAGPILFLDGSGARDVEVQGALYNVEFTEGTCLALFSGCDEATDFAFQSEADAAAAAQALLDTVLLNAGAFDFEFFPALVEGCEDVSVCNLMIPWRSPVFSEVDVVVARNGAVLIPDGVVSGVFPDRSFFTDAASTWAVFTLVQAAPVPEPGTIGLLGLGIIGFALLRPKEANRRRRA